MCLLELCNLRRSSLNFPHENAVVFFFMKNKGLPVGQHRPTQITEDDMENAGYAVFFF